MIIMAQVTAMKRGDVWQYRFEGAKVDGKRQRITKSGFRTKKEALEAGTKALAEYNQSGLHFTPSEISVSDYFDYWLETYCKLNLKETTVKNYDKKIRLYIRPQIGKYRLKSLTAAIIQEFLNKCFDNGLSRNTLLCIKGIITGSLNYAVQPLGFIQFNPALSCKLPLTSAKPKKEPKTKERMACTKEEIKAIFERFPAGHPAHVPLQLAYRCGLRLGECFGLSWEDIDFNKRTLTVNHQVQMNDNKKQWQLLPPKYNSVRTISLDDTMFDILRKEYDKQQRAIVYYDTDYMQLLADSDGFLNFNDGIPVHMVNSREDGEFIQPRILQHVGRVIHGHTRSPMISEKWDFHSMRHTHATMLLEAGAQPKVVQERLGHKDIQTTLNIYAHVTQQMEERTVDIMNNIF